MALRRFRGILARRLLVNWRVEAEAARRMLPRGVKPHLVNGYAVAGLCLVRLEKLRPTWMPVSLGIASENLALRMGVERDGNQGTEKSVLIFRRESPSRINGFFCPRIGYGLHHWAQIRAADSGKEIKICGGNEDHQFEVQAQAAGDIQRGSAFGDMRQAEDFFRESECGYSPAQQAGWWDAVRLQLNRWKFRPMHLTSGRSTLIEKMFGPAATVDSAFIIRGLEHTWIPCGRVRLGELPAVAPTEQRTASKEAA